MTSNKQALLILLDTLIEIGEKTTSKEYMIVVLKNIIENMSKDYKEFRYIQIKRRVAGSDPSKILIDEKINGVDPKKVGKAVLQLIKELAGPCNTSKNKNEFLVMLKGYLGHSNNLMLNNSLEIEIPDKL